MVGRAIGMASLAVALAVLTGAAAPARTNVRIITIGAMAFAPAPEGLKAGDRVMWVNRDRFEHTATAKDGSFDVDLKPGAKATTVLEHSGAVEFYCRFHPNMTGKLVVGR